MRWVCGCLVPIGLAGGLTLLPASAKTQDTGQVLFNGKDLTGWKFRGGGKAPGDHAKESSTNHCPG